MFAEFEVDQDGEAPLVFFEGAGKRFPVAGKGLFQKRKCGGGRFHRARATYDTSAGAAGEAGKWRVREHWAATAQERRASATYGTPLLTVAARYRVGGISGCWAAISHWAACHAKITGNDPR